MALLIKRAEYLLVRIPLRFSIRHALASRTANTSGFVVLTADNGAMGIGEFLCRDYVTGETPDDCLRCLRRAAPLLTRAAIDNPPAFITTLWHQMADEIGRYGALCALELALLDLWGKQHNQPVAALLYPGVVKTQQTPVYSAVYPFASGLKLSALHFFYRSLIRAESIKVKGTGRIVDDAAYLARIRRAFPYPVRLRLDLNGSLSPDHADEYFSRMLASRDGVRWFEQPFPKDAWEVSARFQQQFASDAVLCADESVCSMEDLIRAIRHGAFRAVNIRIAKHGGLLNALRLYDKAVQNGLAVQLGCLVGESSVLAYAGLLFAAVTDPLHHYEGCFGTYLITWDAIEPSLTFSRQGRVPLARLPQAGLVPMFNINRLRARAVQSSALGERP